MYVLHLKPQALGCLCFWCFTQQRDPHTKAIHCSTQAGRFKRSFSEAFLLAIGAMMMRNSGGAPLGSGVSVSERVVVAIEDVRSLGGIMDVLGPLVSSPLSQVILSDFFSNSRASHNLVLGKNMFFARLQPLGSSMDALLLPRSGLCMDVAAAAAACASRRRIGNSCAAVLFPN